jgi:hypothetical protein
MTDYKLVPTTVDVWRALRIAHPDMVVFESYSDPDGHHSGGGYTGRMETSFGFRQGDYPIIKAETKWEINPENPSDRINETHEYWLCLPVRDD